MTDKNTQNNIIVHREYNVKNNENEYILRIEIDSQYIYFIVSKLNESLEYIYKNKLDLITIVNKLELNSSKYASLESVLKIFDIVYEKNKIIINIIDDSCNLLIKLINIFEKEVIFEIKLYKEYMSNNDKFNIIYNKIRFLNKEAFGDLKLLDNLDVESIKNKLNELNTKMNKREEQIKNMLNIKDKEINEKLLKQQNEIQKLNDINIEEIIEKKVGEIESKLIKNFNDKMNIIKNQLIDDINKQNQLIEQLKDNNDDNEKFQLIEEKYNKLIESLDFSKKVIKISDDNSDTKNEEENNSDKLMSQKNDIDAILKDNENIKKEVKEINIKIDNADKEIKKIENSIKEKNLLIENMNEKVNKDNNVIMEINKKIEEINNNKKKEKNEKNNKNNKNDKNEKIEKSELMNEINNKIINNENNINKKIEEKMKDINKILENKIDVKQINELSDRMNSKYNELKVKINHNEYLNKINYEFKNEPINLKYKSDISYSNTNAGWNDMFEVFISYKDNKEYVISPNKESFNLDIYRLIDNKKIVSLRGHKNDIRTIRYFVNTKMNNYDEYLISGDDDMIVIVWDIKNDYKILHKIETKYGDFIYSCLLLFPHNIENNYIITSTYSESDKMEQSATKIYSLSNGNFIKYIKYSNFNAVYYLLSWHNKKNNRYYIIQFSYMKIIINDLYEDEIFYET